jgi:hypothetical protein
MKRWPIPSFGLPFFSSYFVTKTPSDEQIRPLLLGAYVSFTEAFAGVVAQAVPN